MKHIGFLLLVATGCAPTLPCTGFVDQIENNVALIEMPNGWSYQEKSEDLLEGQSLPHNACSRALKKGLSSRMKRLLNRQQELRL